MSLKEIKYSRFRYLALTYFKYFEIIPKKFFKFYLFSKEKIKKVYFKERLGFINYKKDPLRKVVLFHCVSLGELNAAINLIELLKEEAPNVDVVVSTNNFSSYEKASTLKCIDRFFSPFDLGFIVSRFFKKINPDIVVIVDGDFWPVFIDVLKNRKTPIVVVGGRFNLIRPFYGYKIILNKNVLGKIDFFGIRSQEDFDELSGFMGKADNLSLTGDLKFALFKNRKASPSALDLVSDLKASKRKIFAAGSTHKGEEEIILDAFLNIQKEFSDLLLIIAPREIDRAAEVLNIAKKTGKRAVLRSEITGDIKNIDIMILDTEGELFEVYSASSFAFVGGSLVYIDRFGGHNILEPAFFGKPVFFGPFMHNFQYLAEQFIKRKIGFRVSNSKELIFWAIKVMKEPDLAQEIFKRDSEFFSENKNVVEENLSIIKKFIVKK